MWTDSQLRILINERKIENDSFHELSCNMKSNFWKGLASKLIWNLGRSTPEGNARKNLTDWCELIKYIKIISHL